MLKYITSERATLFEPNIYIHMIVEIVGGVNDNQLEEAVKKAFIQNEILNSKVVIEENGLAGYKKIDEIENTVTITTKSWRNILREEEKKHFNFTVGELMRVFIVHENDKLKLMICAHHLVGDGKSLVFFMEQVLRNLNKEEVAYEPLKLLEPSMLPKKSELGFLGKFYVNSFNKKWSKTPKVFDFEDYKKMFYSYWNSRKTNVSIEHFNKEELDKLSRASKCANVSINTFLTTAFVAAYDALADVGLAVDARLNDNRSMSNQATGISFKYKYNKNKTFTQNARNIQKRITSKLSDDAKKYFILQFMPMLDPTLLDSVYMNQFGDFENSTSKSLAKTLGYAGNAKEISITNLTRLPIPTTYGAYSIKDFVFIPPVVSYGKNLVGIATLGDEMNISFHYVATNESSRAKHFFEMAMKILRSNMN